MKRTSSTNFNIPYMSICSCKIDNREQFDVLYKYFKSQEYHPKKLEWIIIDDACKDLDMYVRDIIKDDKRIKYFRYPYKLTIGQKRNLANKFSNGEFIVIFDNYCYYPKTYLHCIKNNKLCKESIFAPNYKYIYNIHNNEFYNCKLSSINKNFCTIESMSYRIGILQTNCYDDTDDRDEELYFLKNYSHIIKRLIPSKFCPIQIENNKDLNKLNKLKNSFFDKNRKNSFANNLNLSFDENYYKKKEYETNDQYKINDENKIAVVYTGFIGSESHYCNKYFAKKILPDDYTIIYNPSIEIFRNHKIKYLIYDNDVKVNLYLDKLNDCYTIFIGRDNKDYSYINCNLLIDCKEYKNYYMADNFLYMPRYIMNIPLRNNVTNLDTLLKENNNNNIKNINKKTYNEPHILFENRFINNNIYDIVKKIIDSNIKIACICPGFMNIDNDSTLDSINYYAYDDKNDFKPIFLESYEKLLTNYKFGLCFCNDTENFES